MRIKHVTGIALCAAALIATVFRPALIAAQQDEELLPKELDILRQVLEATLDGSIDSSFPGSGYSVFRTKIGMEYIPTVGAIVTIPVRFPIRPSQEEGAAEQSAEPAGDLWDHYSKTNAKQKPEPARAPAREPLVPPVPPVPPVEPVPPTPRPPSPSAGEQISIVIERADNDIEGLRIVTEGNVGFKWDFSHGYGQTLHFGGTDPYDPVKVSTLTHSVIETIARYGHRLEHLPKTERLLVIIEAPRARTRQNVSFGGAGLHGVEGLHGVNAPKADVKKFVTRDVVVETRQKNRVVREEVKRIRVPGVLWNPSRGRSEPDRRLLTFNKSDLTKETNYDDIKNRVKQVDY